MADYIYDGDFCEITSDKFTEEGVDKGRLVYVVGHRALPITEEDPYTQRIKFFVHLLEGEHVKPNLGLYLMDPNSLARVSEEDQKNLHEIFSLDFSLEPDAAVN